MFKAIPVFLIFLLFTVSSCIENNDGPKIPASGLKAVLDSVSATPGDIVWLTFNADIPQETYKISIEGKPADLIRNEIRHAWFIMPVLDQGPASIDLNSLEIIAPLIITINDYKVITDPDPVYNMFKSGLNGSVEYITQLSKDTISPVSAANVKLLVDLQKNADALYATLTTEEKIQACYFLEKAKFEQVDFASVRSMKSKDSTLKSFSDARSDRFMTLGKIFVVSTTTTVAGIAICVAGFWAPEPTGLTKLIGIGAAATATVSIIVSLKAIDELAEELGVQFSFENLLSNKKAVGLNSILSLDNNIESNVQFYSNYRTLITSDAGSTSAFLVNLFESINSLQSSYNSFKTGINRVKSWFLFSEPVVPDFVNPIKASAVSKPFLTPGANLKLINVTDPGIQLTFRRLSNSLAITASSTTVFGTKDLKFDVVYEDPNLGISTKQTIDLTFMNEKCPATVTDIDGNVYNTVSIGSQCWLKENLKTSRYQNGDPIMELNGLKNDWVMNKEPAYCYFENNAANNDVYGKLYNWYAVSDPRGICPKGWHIPSHSEWLIMINSLGGESVAGGKMKTTDLWEAPNVGADNSSGFSAVPGGWRSGGNILGLDDMGFFIKNIHATFWSSTIFINGTIAPFSANSVALAFGVSYLTVTDDSYATGNSCRCIKD